MNAAIIQVLVGAGIAFGITYITVPILRKVAYLTDLYDKPDNERKLHNRYVPTLGGIAIYLAFFVGFSMSGLADDLQGFPYMAAALTLLFFTGLKDDIVDLSPKVKLGVELLTAGLLIFGCNLYIDNFYGVFGLYEIPFWLSILITTFTLIVVVNSYNLIDGIDGLAGGIGSIASLAFGIGFGIAGEYAFAALSIILFVTLMSFLIYNFNPASIFMGDTGSLIVGFLLSFLAIKFVGLNSNPAYTEVFGATSPIMPVAILALPLFDTISVFYKRMLKRKSPFSPGRDHIHHAILNTGVGHKGTSILLYACSIFIIFVALSVRSININLILIATIASMFLLLPTNGFKRSILKRMGVDVELLFESDKELRRLKDENEKTASVNEKTQPVHSAVNGTKESSLTH